MDAIWTLEFARNMVFFSGNRRFRCGEKLAHVRDGCGRRRFSMESVSICARAVTEVSQSLFLLSVQTVLLCFATQCPQISVEWLRQGFSKGTCSSVWSCDSECVLQVMVGRSHWNCYLTDAIWTSGFARNMAFFRVIGGFVAEKSWPVCATVAGVVAFAWNLSRSARAL